MEYRTINWKQDIINRTDCYKMEIIDKKLCLLNLLKEHPKTSATFGEISEQLIEHKCLLAVVRKDIEKSRAMMDKIKAQQKSIHILRCKLNHMKKNYPADMKVSEKAVKPPLETVPTVAVIPEETTNKENISSIRVKKKRSETARLDVISEDTFASIPKHIKGHITLAQLNSAVNEINAILIGKYKFLERPRKTLNHKDELKRSNYITMGKDLKGTPYSIFFMDADILQFATTLKVKKKTRDNVFLILRHIGKMKEMRKGRLPRYCILG